MLKGRWPNVGLLLIYSRDIRSTTNEHWVNFVCAVQRRWPNAILILGHRRRRWPNIKTALPLYLVWGGVVLIPVLWCLWTSQVVPLAVRIKRALHAILHGMVWSFFGQILILTQHQTPMTVKYGTVRKVTVWHTLVHIMMGYLMNFDLILRWHHRVIRLIQFR